MSPWSGKKHYKEFLEDMISNINIKEDEIEVTQYFMWTMLFVGEKINHVKNLFMLLIWPQTTSYTSTPRDKIFCFSRK